VINRKSAKYQRAGTSEYAVEIAQFFLLENFLEKRAYRCRVTVQ